MLAAIVAYAVNGWFVGWQSLFQVPQHLSAAGVADYGWYIALGPPVACLLPFCPRCFIAFEMRLQPYLYPSGLSLGLGGLLLGMMALCLPEVLGGGMVGFRKRSTAGWPWGCFLPLSLPRCWRCP